MLLTHKALSATLLPVRDRFPLAARRNTIHGAFATRGFYQLRPVLLYLNLRHTAPETVNVHVTRFLSQLHISSLRKVVAPRDEHWRQSELLWFEDAWRRLVIFFHPLGTVLQHGVHHRVLVRFDLEWEYTFWLEVLLDQNHLVFRLATGIWPNRRRRFIVN